MTDLVQTPPTEVAAQFQRSGLFPDLQSEAQAFVKILAGQELGIGPMAAVAGLNVIKGKVTFSANLLAAMVKRHPAYDYRVRRHTADGCQIVFLQNGEEIGESVFTIDDAKRAGLGGHNWTKYPKAMLFARALTQGVRWYCPDVTSGTPAYSPDEIGDQGVSEEVIPGVVVEEGGVEAPISESSGGLDHSQRPREDVRLDRLAELVDQFEFTEEQREGLRDFVRAGGGNAIESAIVLLEDGNVSALFAGMEWEAGR